MSTFSLNHRHARALYDPDSVALTAKLFPFIPLDAPGMPAAGPNFIAHATVLGDEIDAATVKRKKTPIVGEKLVSLYRSALYNPQFMLPVAVKNELMPVQFLPGHVLGHVLSPNGVAIEAADDDYGPRPSRVMVVGRFPGAQEIGARNAMSGSGMRPFRQALRDCLIPTDEYLNWYVTFACKFSPPDLDITAVPAAWLKDCAVLLAQEIRLVRPDYILCLGNEATKAVLGTTGSVSNLIGRAIPLKTFDEDGNPRETTVMPIMHPAYVARKPELYEDFVGQLQRFNDLINDRAVVHEAVDHAEIYTEDTLRAVVDEMIADPDPNANIIAIDCEWHGDHPTEPGAYLRTVQISNKDRWARTIVLRHQGGMIAFQPDLDVVRRELNRLLKSTPERHVRVGGHFFRADLPWLIDFGVDVREEYAPAQDYEDRTHGGWDTSLMYHAVNETAKYGLDACSMRFTGAPVYWEELDKWNKKRKKAVGDDGGYGNVPAHILHPYANYDVDVTRRIMMKFYGTNGTDGLLASDSNGLDCWVPYWTAHGASLAFLEMELTGLVIDRDRADELTTLFMNTQDRILSEIRDELNWPEFNPKSQPQLAVALFGREFGGRYTNPPAIPEDARPLDLDPIKTTGKRPTLWVELRFRGGDPATATPSTDKESLGILGHANSTAAKIRDYKFISQVLQSVLRKPSITDDGDYTVDENGNFTYEKGLVGCVHADGKVRTHFFQTKETGRASSSRPPLQNLSKRREEDYARILGPDRYRHPVRSILRVPEGYVGIESDLTGAELAVLAWLSQDQNMIEHVRRNNLPSKHPDHYDIHSQQAVKAFNLTGIPPTKKGLDSIGKLSLRVAAKNVNFGIPYGRGPEAIARQCKEEGTEVTPEECQVMIDAYFSTYPRTQDFLAECRKRSQNPGWLVGPYGRVRRFASADFNRASSDRGTKSYAIVGEQERQAQNFPIQGGVADAVSMALANFYWYRHEHPEIDYKIALQIHDAVVVIVPIEHAERVYKEVIPKCMVEDVPFWPRHLDGTPIPVNEPYRFATSRDVFVHWGEDITHDEIKAYGMDWLLECED
jgi:uracil-DNA glycosylase family 4